MLVYQRLRFWDDVFFRRIGLARFPAWALPPNEVGTSTSDGCWATSKLDGSVIAFGNKPRLSVETVLIYHYIYL